MNKLSSKITAGLCALMLMLTLGSTAYAGIHGSSSSSSNSSSSSSSSSSDSNGCTFDCNGNNDDPVRVPEPSTMALFGLGLLALGVSRRFRRRK